MRGENQFPLCVPFCTAPSYSSKDERKMMVDQENVVTGIASSLRGVIWKSLQSTEPNMKKNMVE